MREDYINTGIGMQKDDRVIREIYTPKEIVHIIQTSFMTYNAQCKLSRSELLLINDFANMLIGRFKDD